MYICYSVLEIFVSTRTHGILIVCTRTHLMFRVYVYTRIFFSVLEFLIVYGLLIKSDLLFTLYSYMPAVINVMRYLFDLVSWTSIMRAII